VKVIEETRLDVSPRDRAALDELERMILERFPDATFVVQESFDPPGIRLLATVDVEDTDDVFEVIVDRLIDMQVYEDLSIHVSPMRPTERIWADYEARRASGVPWLQRSA
jgi:hypothetical protein